MTLLCNSTNDDDDKSYNDQFIIINVTLFSSQEIECGKSISINRTFGTNRPLDIIAKNVPG